MRRDIPPEKSYRGRVFWQHRSLLPNNFQLTGEVGLISDFNFLEQYFEREYDQLKDEIDRRRAEAVPRQQHLERRRPACGSTRSSPVTEWLPRADHFWIGEPLLNDRLTWYEHTSLAFARFKSAQPPTDPAQAAMWGPLPWEAPANSTRPGERLITRHEIDCPFALGAFKFNPYVLGELARWGQNLNFQPENRAYGAFGMRASTSMWAVDPTVQSQMFNVNGIAHKVVFDTDIFYAQSTQNLDTLPLYDQVDDNNIEAYRRWFPFFDFGGLPPPVPLQFDERYYALRRGLGSYVASPSMEIADDLFAARLRARQRWQTKRGPLSNPHIVDWITLEHGRHAVSQSQPRQLRHGHRPGRLRLPLARRRSHDGCFERLLRFLPGRALPKCAQVHDDRRVLRIVRRAVRSTWASTRSPVRSRATCWPSTTAIA